MIPIEKYVHQFGGPMLIFIGTIGCLLNLFVFTQKNLRKNPCSIYFIAYNLANFIYIYSTLLSGTLEVGYSIDVSAYNVGICRLRLYFTVLSNILSPLYIILASIDRVLITSPNALTRQRSTRRLAHICIIIETLFWMLFHIHTLIVPTIIQLNPNRSFCYFQQNVYVIFVSYYLLIKEISMVSLMIVCGVWSTKNIQRINRARLVSNALANGIGTTDNINTRFTKDRQLILMLFMDVSVYGLFSFLYAIFLMYRQITQYYVKSADQVQFEGVIRYLGLLATGIPYCISCYTNLLVSKTFRKQVKKVFS